MNIGDLRNRLMIELEMLTNGKSDTNKAKEVVRLANSTNELLRTELQIKKLEREFKEAGEELILGNIEICKTKNPQ